MKPSRHRHAIPRQLPKLRNLGSRLAWSKQRSKRLIIKIKVTSNGRDSFSRDLFPIHHSVTFLNSVATDTCSSFTGEREYTTGQISVVMGPQFLFLIFFSTEASNIKKKHKTLPDRTVPVSLLLLEQTQRSGYVCKHFEFMNTRG